MKAMRRTAAAFFALAMALSLAACGASESTVVLRGTDDSSGIPTTDTWTLTAKGDIVQTMKEVLELDLSDYDDETKDILISTFETTIVEAAKDIDGVTCTSQTSGSTYTIELTVDCTGSAVKEAADAKLITLDGSSDRISLKQTQASLEGQGYEVVE